MWVSKCPIPMAAYSAVRGPQSQLLAVGLAITSFAAAFLLGTVVGDALLDTELFVPAVTATRSRDLSLGAINERISPRDRRMRRKLSIRAKISGTEQRPRLSVFRSNKHTYGQVIDDVTGRTLAAAGTLEKDVAAKVEGKPRLEQAAEVGRILGQRAKERGIAKIVFDRNGYTYGGRVKAVADGARESGIDF